MSRKEILSRIKDEIRIGNLCGVAPGGDARRIKQECADNIRKLRALL